MCNSLHFAQLRYHIVLYPHHVAPFQLRVRLFPSQRWESHTYRLFHVQFYNTAKRPAAPRPIPSTFWAMWVGAAAAAEEAAVEAMLAAEPIAEETLVGAEVIDMVALSVVVPVATAVVEVAVPVATQVAAVGRVVTP